MHLHSPDEIFDAQCPPFAAAAADDDAATTHHLLLPHSATTTTTGRIANGTLKNKVSALEEYIVEVA